MLTIDGAMGEGGGQVLRTALALAAVTRQPFRIARIRARRSRPGLLRQHLAAVRAITELCRARVHGDALGSTELSFEPGAAAHGEYHFQIGTAGSTTLLLQTVLPPLLLAAGDSRIVFEGGTHNPLAPSLDFMIQTFLPLLQRMGVTASARLERHGFYPAGGGRFVFELRGGAQLRPLQLLERGPIEHVAVRAIVAKIPDHVAVRETQVLANALADLPVEVHTERVDSPGPGNVATVTLRATSVTETFCGFGEVRLRAEKVAHRLAGEVRAYVASGAPVGEYLADQLLLPMVLGDGGEFRTLAPSLHLRTNIDVIHQFIPNCIALDEGTHVVRVTAMPRRA